MTGILHSLIQVTHFSSGFSGWVPTFLSEVLVKGTILLLFAAVVALALRRASAATRHLVWTLALSAMLALPVLVLTLPAWEVPIFSSSPSVTASEATRIHLESSPNPMKDQPVQVTAARQPAKPAWPGAILFVWAIGSMLLWARMAVGETRVGRLARRSQPFETGLATSILENSRRCLGVSRAVELRT